jgi:membrane protease subunit HflK
VERATGEGNRFLSLLQEYREAPQVTRERLYLETLEEVLAAVDKTLIDSQVDILPLLDLAGLGLLNEP